jgi:thiol:disulfide interchange protein DsbC
MATLTDVTIYKFLYPLESLHPSAKSKAIAIWCASDPAKAWSDALLAETVPQLRACPNPVNDNLVLGGALGVVGTPTMIAADGRVLPGAVTAATLDAWLGPAGRERGTP